MKNHFPTHPVLDSFSSYFQMAIVSLLNIGRLNWPFAVRERTRRLRIWVRHMPGFVRGCFPRLLGLGEAWTLSCIFLPGGMKYLTLNLCPRSTWESFRNFLTWISPIQNSVRVKFCVFFFQRLPSVYIISASSTCRFLHLALSWRISFKKRKLWGKKMKTVYIF